MILISHRRNTIEQLKNTPSNYGVEIDIRSMGDTLIVQHDPYVPGVFFDDWIKEFRHQTLILNVKEEGLEGRLIKIMAQYEIDEYFFLDQSFPFLIKWSNLDEHRCAVRVSEYESIETALSLAGKVSWIWVDCFTKFPLEKEQANKLKAAGFKLCIVSPELQGKDPLTWIPEFKTLLVERNILVDAVCTKLPELWEKHMGL